MQLVGFPSVEKPNRPHRHSWPRVRDPMNRGGFARKAELQAEIKRLDEETRAMRRSSAGPWARAMRLKAPVRSPAHCWPKNMFYF